MDVDQLAQEVRASQVETRASIAELRASIAELRASIAEFRLHATQRLDALLKAIDDLRQECHGHTRGD